MNELLEIAGNWTVANLAVGIAAVLFLFKICVHTIHVITDWHDRFQKRDEELKSVIAHIDNCPEWRNKTFEAINDLHKSISVLAQRIEENSAELAKIKADNIQKERNELRDRLLVSYRYFTSMEKNPMQAWSEMEADAFWDTYQDYVDRGGNSHIKGVVKPAMRELTVVPMSETEKVTELMQSRNG